MKVIEQLRALSDERFCAIYETLAQDGFGPLDGEVAKALKFRPQAIRKLPMVQRAKRARRLVEVGGMADMCYELFGTYLMSGHKQLVIDFLDGTGVEHEEGMLKNPDTAKPDTAKLGPTVAELDKNYDPADVTLYLSVAAEQWPSFEELESIWRLRL